MRAICGYSEACKPQRAVMDGDLPCLKNIFFGTLHLQFFTCYIDHMSLFIKHIHILLYYVIIISFHILFHCIVLISF